MLERRELLIGFGGLALGAIVVPGCASALQRKDARGKALAGEMARIEREVGGRLGVAYLDTADGYRFGWRAGERFPLCSTFKFVLVSAVLRAVEQGRERLDRAIPVGRADIISYSPVVEKAVGRTMTVEALCEATMTLSDNAAANLLLPAIGGVGGFNAFVRTLGDDVTRLDRDEPALGLGTPGDPRDTTAPDAMLRSMRAILLGDALASASRDRVTGWMIASRTGAARIRAGLPGDWRVGDKTGSGGNGSTNDIAIAWPPSGRPVLIASYLTDTKAPDDARYAALAEAARILIA